MRRTPDGAWRSDEALSRITHGFPGEEEGENGLDRALRLDYPAALALFWEGEQVPDGIFRLWFQADDICSDGLSDMLYDDLDRLVEIVLSLRRNGRSLGEVVVLP